MPHLPHQTYHYHRPSLSLTATMREVTHTLGDIDFAAELELENAEARTIDPELKAYIKDRIRAAHWERRQPYLDLLETLRWQQHRRPFASGRRQG